MNLRYREQEKTNYKNSMLSATKPDTILSLNQQQKNNVNLKSQTKAILKVYVDEETNKKYVEVAAAYALGLTNVRAIMTSTRYKEVTDDKINEVRKRNFDIEFEKLPKKNKQKIQIFYEDNQYYISSGAAYSLGYIDVTKFNMEDNIYGPLTDEEIKNIKNNFEIEFKNIKIQSENSKTL